ncbi:protein translocase subunit SecD [Brevibacterium jeotgali]|uniref:Protein translocase subunit SecD n=1 Tax=Brevibacterium jeotgali TaxID=1262550 RepID=A0A2H1L2C3_9MICO|nr:protein translocase subunit SecD [Brevibacterium jeotgali]TWC02976.1 preprotein translocase subunit SecD [Brevibacterium jeotgali]SMY10999.1 preprotein translocase subunit SecD [Brevibacterium jeotgali]
MAAPSNKPRPVLSFVWLGVVAVALTVLIGAGAIWSSATWAPKLALDLEGGTSIILEPQVDEDTAISQEQLEQAVAIIRQRVDSTGVSEAEISTQGDRNIVVNLPGNPDEETRNLVRSSAQLAFRRVAFVGAPAAADQQQGEPAPEETEDPNADLSDEDRQRLEELLGDEAAAEGSAEDAPQGGGAVTPDEQAGPQAGGGAEASADQAQAPAGEGGEADGTVPRFDPQSDMSWADDEVMARFAELDCTDPANRTGGTTADSDEMFVSCAQDGSAKYILGPVELDGSHVADADHGFETSSTGTQTNRVAVTLEFDSVGREVFGQITTAITGQQQPYDQFAIVLDGLVLSAPQSQTPVTDGNAQITGAFTMDEGETLANQLKNGALPISFQVQSEQQISPTLGSDYLAKGMLAGAIGLGLVVIYSLVQYRVLGTVTVSSLAVAGGLTYLLLLLVTWRYGYRLSLAGVAGLIVGIGAAADSFIVYFERIRDELRGGRKLTSAVEIGWYRAKRTIFASKAVNLLAAVILYLLAVGSVRGFAFTLGLTVVVDLLVTVLFTHPILQLLAQTRFFGDGHRMSGMDPRQLGVSRASYRGALNIDLDRAKRDGTKKGSHKEAARRQKDVDKREERAGAGLSLAERKARAQRDAEESGRDATPVATDEPTGGAR